MFPVAERMFTDAERTFTDGKHTFSIGEYKISRGIAGFLTPRHKLSHAGTQHQPRHSSFRTIPIRIPVKAVTGQDTDAGTGIVPPPASVFRNIYILHIRTRCFRSFLYQVHELVKFRRNDNLGAAVTLLAYFGAVAGHGIIFATTAGSEPLRIYAILILQGLHD